MRIRYDEYLKIRKSLRTLRDIAKLPYPRGMLLSILQQKKVESVKRKYHVFASRLDDIVDYWKRRRSFPRWLTLTPVMKVRLLLKGLGFSAKAINKALRNPEEVDDERLASVIRRAVVRDYVYSPLAAKLQSSKGKLGERMLEEILQEFGVEFKTEKELRGEFSKTPDFYLEEPLILDGNELKWIESKAMFGDPRTHEMYEKKQYSRYRELFGYGIVVYWAGCVEGIEAYDGSRFRNCHPLLDMRIYLGGSDDDAERLECVFVEVDCDDVISAAEKIIDAFAYGRVVASCSDRAVGSVLRNVGFDVVYLV